ncbi:serine/threonine kinase, SPS1 [Schizophyllum amplum]|uniref:Serine/threonine kinase, SPS1 n=1 Tax=Schizophyllum amplum TaxID=97359 RepID=A0A550CV26_9AGAR|nr:serine/threonine kinase, SPS1 [Auriculariopsis ampla]
MSSPTFVASDPQSVSDYCTKMRGLQAASWQSPLGAGMPFLLQFTCTRSEPSDDDMQCVRRSPPQLPYGETCEYALSRPLQVGHDCNSQVWVASHTGQDYADVVLKFIAPSGLPLPSEDPDMTAVYVEFGEYRYPEDVINRQVSAYLALAKFQGSTLPYFFGVQQAVMPWGEEASVLALEYLPGPPLSAVKDAVDSDPLTSKYRNFESYLALAQSAFTTLRAAHRLHIYHRDLRERNVLVDETNDFAVIIDWHNDPRTIDVHEIEAQGDLYDIGCTFLRCDMHHEEMKKMYRRAYLDVFSCVYPYELEDGR